MLRERVFGRWLPAQFWQHKLKEKPMSMTRDIRLGLLVLLASVTVAFMPAAAQAQKKPNIVMLMTDDTGWQDFGAYTGGGAALGHPTPNVDQIAKEGAARLVAHRS
jgi:hypothetical protein